MSLYLGSGSTERASATWIEDADRTWAVFGQLPTGATQHVAFARPAGGRIRARVLVQTRQANLALDPWLVLVGPGLERPAPLDALLPPGEGALFVAPPPSRELELFEPSQFAVLAGASLELWLPADGPYYLLVFDPSGQAGAYILDIGYLLD